jgi:ribosomal protein L11 methyltransferase
VFVLSLVVSADEADFVMADLAEFGTLGVEEQLGGWEAWFASEAEAQAAAVRFPGSAVRRIPDQNWNAPAQQRWEARAVGDRFWLTPGDEAPEGKIRLKMRPGLAFGAGDHPTTRLALRAIERWVRPGMRFGDIGCGVGLLCEAAAALGAEATGCDVDSEAIRIAREAGIDARLGSIEALPGDLDVVALNVTLNLHRELLAGAAGLLRTLVSFDRPGGALIATGILLEQRQELEAIAGGMEAADVEVEEGWLGLVFHTRAG